MGKGYVLSLCDRTGNMVLPWLEDGFDVVTIDLQAAGWAHPGRTHLQEPVGGHAAWQILSRRGRPTAVFAFPPCTHLAASGARHWKDKGLGALIDALKVVEACRKVCEESGAPWLIENPIGSLSTHWRKPDHQFDPCDLAGYAPDPASEAYTKKTCYWIGGGLVMPRARRVEPIQGSRMHTIGETQGRANERSVTPLGLAYGVFEANEPERKRLRELMQPEAV